jgi:polysaccharide pyruvyl transferase WcaK-like protein
MPDAAFLISQKSQIQKGILGLSINGSQKVAWENLLMSIKLISGLKKIYIFNFFPNQDGGLCQEILKVLAPSHPVEIVEAGQILEKISHCEKMIASRYHALILAMGVGAAAVGVSSSTKIVRLCQIYNQTHLNLDLKPKELTKLIQESMFVPEAQILDSKNKTAQAFAMLASHLK